MSEPRVIEFKSASGNIIRITNFSHKEIDESLIDQVRPGLEDSMDGFEQKFIAEAKIVGFSIEAGKNKTSVFFSIILVNLPEAGGGGKLGGESPNIDSLFIDTINAIMTGLMHASVIVKEIETIRSLFEEKLRSEGLIDENNGEDSDNPTNSSTTLPVDPETENNKPTQPMTPPTDDDFAEIERKINQGQKRRP